MILSGRLIRRRIAKSYVNTRLSIHYNNCRSHFPACVRRCAYWRVQSLPHARAYVIREVRPFVRALVLPGPGSHDLERQVVERSGDAELPHGHARVDSQKVRVLYVPGKHDGQEVAAGLRCPHEPRYRIAD